MVDLVQWLRAQLDEDERIAREAGAVRGPVWWYEGYFKDIDGQVIAGEVLDQGSAAVRSLAMTTRSDAEGEHAAAHDPARVLDEIDAKRRTLIRCEEAMLAASPMLVHFAKQTVWDMAKPYSQHPGFKESWRP